MKFDFYGERKPCEHTGQHLPHVLDYYSNPRFAMDLEVYCPGDVAGIEIVEDLIGDEEPDSFLAILEPRK